MKGREVSRFSECELTRSTEHARLKDHVASMPGGLEAKIQEGGKQDIPLSRQLCCPTTIPLYIVPTSWTYAIALLVRSLR